MPTGYTAPLYEGTPITPAQFILRCARAMGAAIMQRDDHPDVEIQLREVDTKYHDDRLKDLRRQLEAANARTDAEWAAMREAEIVEARRTAEEVEAKQREIYRRYVAMQKAIRSWKPPTEEHYNLRKFMLDQIDESIKFDTPALAPGRDTGWSPDVPEEIPVAEYRAKVIRRLSKSIANTAEHIEKEHALVRSQNAWVTALRDSLPDSDAIA